MRLGFYYHIPAIQKENQILLPGYFGRFLDSMASACDHLIFFAHTPRPEDLPNMDYSVKSKNINLVSMGPRLPAWRMSLFPWSHTQTIKTQRESMDILFIRGPTPLLPALARSFSSFPKVLLLVGDYVSGVDDLPQPFWRKELIRYWSYWNKYGQIHAAKKSLTFVNSQQLYDELEGVVPDLRKTHTTNLTEADFFIRQDTCQTKPYHILYAGRMDRSKGLMNILEAVVQLVHQGEDLIFDLVGPAEKGDFIWKELSERAKQLNCEERIIYHGYKPFDPDLLLLYRQADILVIASLSNFEGFPRVIWEAMANSVPVVATRVGSIPAYLDGSAQLVEPRDINSLKSGIYKMIHDETFRKQCIFDGYTLAKKNTLQIQMKAMFEEIETWLRSKTG